MNRDIIEGKAKQVQGHVEDAVADLTGNAHANAEGKARVAEGKVQETVGRAKDAVKRTVDKALG